MAKDPAALLYIDKWLVSTKGMRANTRGWYLNLILHQYDKGELPNDIEELANLADVRISEYEDFKQVFEQVLKHKFEVNNNGCLENTYAKEILQKREAYKDKRSNSGKLSYVLQYFRKHFKYKKDFEDYFKENVTIDFDIKNEQVLKQVFEQNFELYINVNKDEVKHTSLNKNIPNIYDVVDFFVSNGYSEEAARKAFMYYDDAKWHDSRGKKVLNWKQKMRAVWFKDENKVPEHLKTVTKPTFVSSLKDPRDYEY